MSGAKRAKESEAKRLAAGYRVVRVFLPPEAAAALDSLTTRFGITMTDAIETALLNSARHIEMMDSLVAMLERDSQSSH